jgi:hypothetical protein
MAFTNGWTRMAALTASEGAVPEVEVQVELVVDWVLRVIEVPTALVTNTLGLANDGPN